MLLLYKVSSEPITGTIRTICKMKIKNFWNFFVKNQKWLLKKIVILRVLVKALPGVVETSNCCLLIEDKFFSWNDPLEGISYFHEMLQKEATKTEKMHFWYIVGMGYFSFEFSFEKKKPKIL